MIMAGGRGTRLGALTQKHPEAADGVADRTILEWIVLNLVGGGIRDIHVSVNHLADQIEEHLGDGSRLGCTVRYLREDPDCPLGTAGSLAAPPGARPDRSTRSLVMNGDLMFAVRRRASCSRFHDAARRRGHRGDPAVPARGAVRGGRARPDQGVAAHAEKPVFDLEVNAGIYAVSPEALDLVPTGTPSTMPDLIQQCLDKGGKVSAWPLSIGLDRRRNAARSRQGARSKCDRAGRARPSWSPGRTASSAATSSSG